MRHAHPDALFARRSFLRLAALAGAALAVGGGERAASADGAGPSNAPWPPSEPPAEPPELQATSAHAPRVARADSFILLWLNGGPSHLDTFDPKTSSPALFRSIRTAQRGVRFTEHLPRLAAEANRLTVLRSLTSREGNHDRARHCAHTSYSPSPTVSHPAFGAWVDAERGRAGAALPASVSLGGPGGNPGILGARHAPLVVRRAGEAPEGARSGVAVGEVRSERRRAYLADLEREAAAREADPAAVARAAVARDALRLSRSAELDVFDVASEPKKTLADYGDSAFGRGCLVARRLVERKVPFIEVTLDGWDVHTDAAERQQRLLGQLDAGMSALLRDLAARDLLGRTLVLCMGEFGRSPRLNANGGRDHHPAVYSALLAGGGSRPGAFGASDPHGARVASDPLTLPDLYATCATLMGIDPAMTRASALGRPIAVTDGGRPVPALIA